MLVIVKTFILTRISFPSMYQTTAHSISSLYFEFLISSIEDLSQALNTCFPGHNYIGSEHLLLGLLREGEGVAARVLESLGADPSNIRTQVNLYLMSISDSREFSVQKEFLFISCFLNVMDLYRLFE